MSSRERIAFVVNTMDGGGAERVAALLCNRWADDGHVVTLMMTNASVEETAFPLNRTITLQPLGTNGRARASRVQRFQMLKQRINSIDPTRVISFLPHVNIPTILATRGRSTPVIVSERRYPPGDALPLAWRLARRAVYPLATCVVMQTSQGRDWLAKECPNARAAVIPNPISLPLPSGHPKIAPALVVDPARRVLLSVGRLIPDKQPGLLLSAFAQLACRFPDVDLVMLGEGPQRCTLMKQRDALGLSSRVKLPGFAGNLGDWYARAAVFALASRYEGFPNALAEALAHGIHAVSFDCPTGPRDLITHPDLGALIPIEQGVAGMVRALETALAKPNPIPRLVVQGLIQRYDIGAIAQTWLDIS